jgi:acylphosphatase
VTRRYLVEGDVQGVGFRYFTLRQALKLGIRGWVRNLPDGRVEALGAGAAGDLARFEAALRRGPDLARVATVEVHETEDEAGMFKSFIIR